MNEEPLRDYEIKILRGVIDEHRRKMEREEVTHRFWTTGKLWAVSVAAVVIFILQVVVAILTIRHG